LYYVWLAYKDKLGSYALVRRTEAQVSKLKEGVVRARSRKAGEEALRKVKKAFKEGGEV